MAAIEGEATARERLWQAMQECGLSNKVFSRQRIQAMTGLRMSIIDDHLERIRDDGKIIKVLAGTYELVPEFPPPVLISYTRLDNGMIKIERGDTEWLMSPMELRTHAKMVAGWANELAGVEQVAEMAITVGRLENDMRRLKRAYTADCSCSTHSAEIAPSPRDRLRSITGDRRAIRRAARG